MKITKPLLSLLKKFNTVYNGVTFDATTNTAKLFSSKKHSHSTVTIQLPEVTNTFTITDLKSFTKHISTNIDHLVINKGDYVLISTPTERFEIPQPKVLDLSIERNTALFTCDFDVDTYPKCFDYKLGSDNGFLYLFMKQDDCCGHRGYTQLAEISNDIAVNKLDVNPVTVAKFLKSRTAKEKLIKAKLSMHDKGYSINYITNGFDCTLYDHCDSQFMVDDTEQQQQIVDECGIKVIQSSDHNGVYWEKTDYKKSRDIAIKSKKTKLKTLRTKHNVYSKAVAQLAKLETRISKINTTYSNSHKYQLLQLDIEIQKLKIKRATMVKQQTKKLLDNAISDVTSCDNRMMKVTAIEQGYADEAQNKIDYMQKQKKLSDWDNASFEVEAITLKKKIKPVAEDTVVSESVAPVDVVEPYNCFMQSVLGEVKPLTAEQIDHINLVRKKNAMIKKYKI
ncbi:MULTISPECIES: hypothetical protein [Photobacterium]|uniref:Uncharacterized protein n=1 Tax=Photobacterium toruni TaxID=1935446 RepID=A0ABU6L2U5_9GAMM|nr:hypothetical protein [Photobacterium toruni]